MGKHAYTLNQAYGSLHDVLKKYGPEHLKLDLGCGYCKPDGFIGLDNLIGEAVQIKNEANAPDIYIDLNTQTFPFEDDSCVQVRSSHFLEHSHLDHVINESYRVLKPGGTFVFTVPYANSAEGMYPGHLIFLTEKWFAKNMNFQGKFKVVKEQYDPSEDYRRSVLRCLVPFSLARKFLFNACWQMTMWCTPKK